MKILTIGNSFTWSLQRYFPAVVHADLQLHPAIASAAATERVIRENLIISAPCFSGIVFRFSEI